MTVTKEDLEAITKATELDGDGNLVAAMERITAGMTGDGVQLVNDLQDLVVHLVNLLDGKAAEVRTLRSNINRLCPRELAARIVQD